MELPIFLREHFNGMYRTDVYFLSKTLAEVPLYILFPFGFISITYYMVGFNPDFDRFLIACLVVVLVANVACSFGKKQSWQCIYFHPIYRNFFDIIGYMISCISGSVTMALSLAPPLIIPFMLFGGFFLNKG